MIYRKYYGAKTALRIPGIFFAAMAAAGYVIELVFSPLGLVPDSRNAQVVESSVSWNYTTWLNIVFLAIAAALLARFVTTGGIPMLKMMGGDPQGHVHGGHERESNASDHGESGSSSHSR